MLKSLFCNSTRCTRTLNHNHHIASITVNNSLNNPINNNNNNAAFTPINNNPYSNAFVRYESRKQTPPPQRSHEYFQKLAELKRAAAAEEAKKPVPDPIKVDHKPYINPYFTQVQDKNKELLFTQTIDQIMLREEAKVEEDAIKAPKQKKNKQIKNNENNNNNTNAAEAKADEEEEEEEDVATTTPTVQQSLQSILNIKPTDMEMLFENKDQGATLDPNTVTSLKELNSTLSTPELIRVSRYLPPLGSGSYFAIVNIKNNQYKVVEDDLLMIDNYPGEIGSQVTFDNILLLATKSFTLIGRPRISTASVVATIEEHTETKKVIVFHKKRRKNHRRRAGFRHKVTILRINKIIFPESEREAVRLEAEQHWQLMKQAHQQIRIQKLQQQTEQNNDNNTEDNNETEISQGKTAEARSTT